VSTNEADFFSIEEHHNLSFSEPSLWLVKSHLFLTLHTS
jgi:hypothetical protein